MCHNAMTFLNTDRGFIRSIEGAARTVEFTNDARFAKPLTCDVATGFATILVANKSIRHWVLLEASDCDCDQPLFDVGDDVVDLDGQRLKIELVDPTKHSFIACRLDSGGNPTTANEIVGFEQAIARHWKKAA